ncbi:restriction endonuclease subunit S [Desulfococcaceae bacterium HSG7]|nr:restriction endonuclease subunit S [Desulfococcaceae bacterium HSG7]
MNIWQSIQISKIAEIISGFAFKSAELLPDAGNGIAILKIANVINPTIKLDFQGYLPREKFSKRHHKYLIKENDVLVAMTGMGSVGRIGVAKNIRTEILLNQRVGLIRSNSALCEQKFLGIVLTQKIYERILYDLGIGAGQPNVSPKDIGNLLIPLPPLSIQKKFIALLSTYDDLIENNKRRIALLEKMAEEIYREWFVRFRFPGYDKVKFEKGVPEGWRISNISTLGKIITGKTPSKKILKYYNGKYWFIKTPDMHGNMFVYNTNETLTEEGIKSQPSQTIPENSICVSCIGTGGVVSITTSTCQTNQQINSVVLKEVSDIEWVFFTLKNLKKTIKLFGGTGTTMTNLSKGKFQSLKILRPPSKLRKAYHKISDSVFNQLKNITLTNISLQKTRNMLLPRLISGKLSVENLNIKFPPSMLTDEQPEPQESAHA